MDGREITLEGVSKKVKELKPKIKIKSDNHTRSNRKKSKIAIKILEKMAI